MLSWTSVDPSFFAKHRIHLEQDDDGFHCFADQRLKPATQHLLLYLTQGKLKITYVDTARFEALGDSILDEEADKGDADKFIVKWAQEVLTDAIEAGASDIHIEPRQFALQVRYRLDGNLQIAREFGLEYRDEIISRFKVLADLDIAEKRKPQDGKIHYKMRRRYIDCRVSTIPTAKGEKVVIRILDPSKVRLDLTDLGMPDYMLHDFKKAIHLPFGLILVTGPTGSGKTTTLYGALNEISSEHLNIMTIEDPIEYQLEGLNQSQVRPQIDYGFKEALRSFLRQDPNVIMLGEIRDSETAEMAMRASMTGHLVFSTLHTNSAAGTMPRLTDMGVEPYLVASSLQMAIGQRLLRRLCQKCKIIDQTALQTASRYSLDIPVDKTVYTANGCDDCRRQGFRGRVGVFEGLTITDSLREQIHRRASETEILAAIPGHQSLLDHGLHRLFNGETALSELLAEVATRH
jgi:type II secretory ATPase GspE/PulE/Tfp pilus assembly ATPase PilB-like protein